MAQIIIRVASFVKRGGGKFSDGEAGTTAAFPSARPYDLRRSTTIDIDDIAETVFSDGVVRIVGFDRSQEVPIGVAYFELGA